MICSVIGYQKGGGTDQNGVSFRENQNKGKHVRKLVGELNRGMVIDEVRLALIQFFKAKQVICDNACESMTEGSVNSLVRQNI